MVGRVDMTDPLKPQFNWSGSGFVAAFRGKSAFIELKHEKINEFTVIIDGVRFPKITAKPGLHKYTLADNLSEGTHVIEFYRQTEALFGITQMTDLDLGFSHHDLEPPPVTRRIEVIGDSITTGYGTENLHPECTLLPEHQDHYVTYTSIAARALNAELITIAWSGRSIVDIPQVRVKSMIHHYEQVLPPQKEPKWDFSSTPDIVIINLGTNDFSDGNIPNPSILTSGYLSILKKIRHYYAKTYILATLSPMLGESDLVVVQNAIKQAIGLFHKQMDKNIKFWPMNFSIDLACDYHPSITAHRYMADALIPQLTAIFRKIEQPKLSCSP